MKQIFLVILLFLLSHFVLKGQVDSMIMYERVYHFMELNSFLIEQYKKTKIELIESEIKASICLVAKIKRKDILINLEGAYLKKNQIEKLYFSIAGMNFNEFHNDLSCTISGKITSETHVDFINFQCLILNKDTATIIEIPKIASGEYSFRFCFLFKNKDLYKELDFETYNCLDKSIEICIEKSYTIH